MWQLSTRASESRKMRPVIALTRGRHELLWNGDMQADGTMDKWTVFVIARGSGSRHSSVVVTQEPASIRKLVAQSLGGNRREYARVGFAVNHACVAPVYSAFRESANCIALSYDKRSRRQFMLTVKHDYFLNDCSGISGSVLIAIMAAILTDRLYWIYLFRASLTG